MIKDLTGNKYGRWTVLKLSEKKYRSMIMWLCKCECGVEREIIGNNLVRGISKSCGCLKIERTKITKTKHGQTIDGKIARLYRIWQGMKERCLYPSQTSYKNYGGKGVKVCKEWLDFSVFREWAVANGYNDNLSIDRIDSNGNYEPSNCRWVTKTNQARNNSHNTMIEIEGKTKCLAEWCEIYGISHKTVGSRIKRGWEPIKALTTPAAREG